MKPKTGYAISCVLCACYLVMSRLGAFDAIPDTDALMTFTSVIVLIIEPILIIREIRKEKRMKINAINSQLLYQPRAERVYVIPIQNGKRIKVLAKTYQEAVAKAKDLSRLYDYNHMLRKQMS